MSVEESDFYKIANTLAFAADWDTTARLNHGLCFWCDRKDSDFLPHEILLGKTKNVIMGISASFHYMRLSVVQISQSSPFEELRKEGFSEYDLYRYHYVVYNHSVALLQDLLFKLVAIVFGFNIRKRLIGWNVLCEELDKIKNTEVKTVLEDFYETFSKHIEKRNRFSHEGKLYYSTLNDFYMTEVWSNMVEHSNVKDCEHSEFLRNTPSNIRLRKDAKNKFISELNESRLRAEKIAIKLGESCLNRLLSSIDYDFYEKHCELLRAGNCERLNNYLASIGL